MTNGRPDLFRHVGVEVGAPLPPFAWPGGYLLVYSTLDGASVCADCANKTDAGRPGGKCGRRRGEELSMLACTVAACRTPRPARSAREWAVRAGVVIVPLTGR